MRKRRILPPSGEHLCLSTLMSESQPVSCGCRSRRDQQLLTLSGLEQKCAMPGITDHGEHDQVCSSFWNIPFLNLCPIPAHDAILSQVSYMYINVAVLMTRHI